MTVSYASRLDNSNRFSPIFFRWEGSIYKLIWIEFLIFVIVSVIVGLTRINILNEFHKEKFDSFCLYCLYISTNIPVAFILPFFVRLIVDRRFAQFKTIPWIDQMAIYINTFVQGNSEALVLTKRTIIRYLVLSMALCFQTISAPAARKFKDQKTYVTAGLATEEEIQRFSEIQFRYNLYFVPIVWAGELLRKADRFGAIIGERCVALLMNEITLFYDKLQAIFFYDWINVPLVYTQVSTICAYMFFITSIFGGQVIGKDYFAGVTKKNHYMNVTAETTKILEYVSLFPLFGMIQFGIYVGWLKVAETMINPYGDDDEDIEIVAIIERNLQIGYQIVDKINTHSPIVIEDVIPIYLKAGYTEGKSVLFHGSQWQIHENEEEIEKPVQNVYEPVAKDDVSFDGDDINKAIQNSVFIVSPKEMASKSLFDIPEISRDSLTKSVPALNVKSKENIHKSNLSLHAVSKENLMKKATGPRPSGKDIKKKVVSSENLEAKDGQPIIKGNQENIDKKEKENNENTKMKEVPEVKPPLPPTKKMSGSVENIKDAFSSHAEKNLEDDK